MSPDNLVGKKFSITGMLVEVIADEGDKWQCRNHTTNDTMFIDKAFLEQSIRLGKAEEVEE